MLIRSFKGNAFTEEYSFCHTNFSKSTFGKVFLFEIALAKVVERV
jgi:hypothetical protein